MVDVMGMHQDLFAAKVCTQVLILVSLLFYIIYCISQRATEAHAFLAIIGYHVFIVTALVWYHQVGAVYVHIAMFFFGMIFAGAGTGMALMRHGCMNTVHAWFGFTAFAFGIVTFFVGIIMTIAMEDITTDFIIIFLAIMTLILAALALITGLVSPNYYAVWASCMLLIFHIFIIVLYCTLTIAMILHCLYEDFAIEPDVEPPTI